MNVDQGKPIRPGEGEKIKPNSQRARAEASLNAVRSLSEWLNGPRAPIKKGKK